MDWTPEIIGGITVGAMAVAGAIKKYGLIPKLFAVKNGVNGTDGKNGKTFDVSGCLKRFDECSKKQVAVEKSVQTIAEIQKRNISRGIQNKEKLKLGAERFDKVEQSINTINTNVAVIRERIEQQNKHQNAMMKMILEKI